MATENQKMANNESFEETLAPEPTKRKRSSILRQPDKRTRDSRTVSFNDKYFYKELYQDGTCELTNIFLGEDMDITMMDVIDPIDCNRTIDSSVDMSIVGSQSVDITLVQPNNNASHAATTINHDTTLDERDMISHSEQQHHHHHHQHQQSLLHQQQHRSSQDLQTSQLSQISEISSLDDTLFGAFHDSMVSNRSSGVDTLMHNVEILNDCIQNVDHETGEWRRKLDAELEDLFKFYRHIVNRNNKYEFAVAIFGRAHSLWLILKVNPETYPNEKLKLRFAVNKKDRHLYPFKEYAEAVGRYAHEGSENYLKRIIINAQKFRRFLNKIGYAKTADRQLGEK